MKTSGSNAAAQSTENPDAFQFTNAPASRASISYSAAAALVTGSLLPATGSGKCAAGASGIGRVVKDGSFS